MDDLAIIENIKNGDTDAYALLVEKYHRPLLTFIFRIVGDAERETMERKGWAALLLGLTMPGMGQLYNGEG